jgi:hypothetical protein
MIKLPAEASSGFLRLSKNTPIAYIYKQLPDR